MTNEYFKGETKEQLLLRRIFKQLEDSIFNDNKMVRSYCDRIQFDRSVGKDLEHYIESHFGKWHHQRKRHNRYYREKTKRGE